MSWQGYVDNLKTADQSGLIPVEEAAICGFEPGLESIWASSPGLSNITVDEIKKLASEQSQKDFYVNGAYIGGTKCRLIRNQLDDGGTMDLKTTADKAGNTFGVCVGKSLKAFVIAKGSKDATGGQLSNKVYKMVDYLKNSNF